MLNKQMSCSSAAAVIAVAAVARCRCWHLGHPAPVRAAKSPRLLSGAEWPTTLTSLHPPRPRPPSCRPAALAIRLLISSNDQALLARRQPHPRPRRRHDTMAAARLPKLTEVLATVHRAGVLELRLNTPENLNGMTVKKCAWRARRARERCSSPCACAGSAACSAPCLHTPLTPPPRQRPRQRPPLRSRQQGHLGSRRDGQRTLLLLWRHARRPRPPRARLAWPARGQGVHWDADRFPQADRYGVAG